MVHTLSEMHVKNDNGDDIDFSGLQVLLYSTQQLGPASMRELSVSGRSCLH